MGKCLKISQNLHEGDRRHVKVCKKKISKSTDESFFTPMSTSIVCKYLKKGLCDLFTDLFECIAYGPSSNISDFY